MIRVRLSHVRRHGAGVLQTSTRAVERGDRESNARMDLSAAVHPDRTHAPPALS
jgi:hypothetical protein